MNITRSRMATVVAVALVAILAVVWFVTHHGSDHKTSTSPSSSSSAPQEPSASSTSDDTSSSSEAAQTQTGAADPSSDAVQSRGSENAEKNADQPLATNTAQYQTISTYAALTNSQNTTGDRAQWFSQMKAITTPSYYASTYASSASQTLSPLQQAQASAWASQTSETPAPTVVPGTTKAYQVSDVQATSTSVAYRVTYATSMQGADFDGNVNGQKADSNQTFTVFLKKVGNNWLIDNITPDGS